MENRKFLTGNQLKIIALIAMTFDHLGVQIFTDNIIFRVIGRIAMPIFAYMISEGCRYTKNRLKYFCTVALVALVCQLVYFFAMGSLYQCIFVTFLFSIAIIYAFDGLKKRKDLFSGIFFCILLVFAFFMTEVLPSFIPETDYRIDYGFFGVILPVLIFIFNKREQKLLMTFIGLCLLSSYYGGIQWVSLLSVVLLALYNGKRGEANLKYLFYIYYPLHLLVIYFLSFVL